MKDRGYPILLVVKHVVSLGFDVLGTHSKSISAWPFNTKRVKIKKNGHKKISTHVVQERNTQKNENHVEN